MRINIILISLNFLFIDCKKDSTPSAAPQPHCSPNETLSTIAPVSTIKNSSTTPERTEGVFHFTSELCDKTGYFNRSKYSREEIEGTYELWFKLSGSLINTPSVFYLKNLKEVRENKDLILSKLDKEFAERKILLQNLKVVNTSYWQNTKKLRYQELLQDYEIKKTEIMAYSDPSILLHNTLFKNCANFAQALNGDESQMIKEWKQLREEMSNNNGDPERIIREFHDHLNSPDRQDYATIDLINFGWGNCSNAQISRVSYDEKMAEAFEALFIKIDSVCEDP